MKEKEANGDILRLSALQTNIYCTVS